METRAQANREDKLRLRQAHRDVAKLPKGANLNREARRLIKSLSRGAKSKRQQPSLASAVSMRRYRVRAIGNLWPVFADSRLKSTTVDITPNGWDYSPSDLLGVNPRKLLAELRAALYRDGAGDSDGYLILFLEAEFRPPHGPFHLHCHGAGAGGMLDVLRKMRKRRKYKKLKGQRAPIVIKKKEIRNTPARLTYILKPDWFAVWRGVKKDGTSGKSGRRRIRGPNGTLFRIWLNRWTIEDICLRIHLTVNLHGQFVVADRKSYKKGGGR